MSRYYPVSTKSKAKSAKEFNEKLKKLVKPKSYSLKTPKEIEEQGLSFSEVLAKREVEKMNEEARKASELKYIKPVSTIEKTQQDRLKKLQDALKENKLEGDKLEIKLKQYDRDYIDELEPAKYEKVHNALLQNKDNRKDLMEKIKKTLNFNKEIEKKQSTEKVFEEINKLWEKYPDLKREGTLEDNTRLRDIERDVGNSRLKEYAYLLKEIKDKKIPAVVKVLSPSERAVERLEKSRVRKLNRQAIMKNEELKNGKKELMTEAEINDTLRDISRLPDFKTVHEIFGELTNSYKKGEIRDMLFVKFKRAVDEREQQLINTISTFDLDKVNRLIEENELEYKNKQIDSMTYNKIRNPLFKRKGEIEKERDDEEKLMNAQIEKDRLDRENLRLARKKERKNFRVLSKKDRQRFTREFDITDYEPEKSEKKSNRDKRHQKKIEAEPMPEEHEDDEEEEEMPQGFGLYPKKRHDVVMSEISKHYSNPKLQGFIYGLSQHPKNPKKTLKGRVNHAIKAIKKGKLKGGKLHIKF